MAHELTGHILQIQGEPTGGIRRHVHSIIFGLRDIKGLKQSYVCSSTGGDSAFRNDIPGLTGILEGRLVRMRINKKPGISDILNLIKLARFVRSQKVSIVHGHGAKGGFYARMLKLMCDVRTVYTPHGGSVHRMFSWPEEAVYTAAEKLLFGLTDYFVFESNYTAQAYFDKVGKRSANWTVNYNGIPEPGLDRISEEAERPGYKRPADWKVADVGVFGMLRKQKGQVLALKAAAELKDPGKRVRLHFFGDGPDRAALESQAATLGLNSIVVFHGEVADPSPHMRAMDVILIPSLFESFGYVAIEAFSMRKPVIASAVGGLTEIITDKKTGLLVPTGDFKAMAAAITHMLDNTPQCAVWVENAHLDFKKRFTLASMLANLEEVYARFLSGCVADR